MGIEVRRRDRDYEITVDGAHAGEAQFHERDGVITFTHTFIDDGYGGQGLGTKLAEAALADVRERALRVVPQCPFIKAHIEKHPEWQDLLA